MYRYTCWVEYFFLFSCGMVLIVSQGFQPENVFYILIAAICVAPASLFSTTIGVSLSLFLFLGVAILVPSSFFFLPAILRIICRNTRRFPGLFSIGVLTIVYPLDVTPLLHAALLCLVILAGYLCLKEKEYVQLKIELLQLKDDSWEKQDVLKEKNEKLIDSQEKMIDLEIAEERNRIARDIHDNVGHLLSSAIIQLGAIETITPESSNKKMIEQLKKTIHSGMDKVRESVHDLHATSLSLEKSLHLLLADFSFCNVNVRGVIPQVLSKTQEKVLLTIIKEALSNVMKHSQASQVDLIFDELPAFYRLKILDNGKKSVEPVEITQGIGLASMRQRVEKVNGQLHIHSSKEGFQINVILLKEGNNDTRCSG